MPTPHKHAAVIKAWADGHVIQWCRDWGQAPTDWVDWYPDTGPSFESLVAFRVKPKLKDPGDVAFDAWYKKTHSDAKQRWLDAAKAVIVAYKAGELDESKLV